MWSEVDIARARLAKALAKQAGDVKYEGQVCAVCESSIRYTKGGNCVECNFRRKGISRERLKAAGENHG